MNCPSCGAEIPADKRYAHLVVCAYCQSTILLDKKAARLAGKMAVLAPPRGKLFVGGSGRVGQHGFSVLGRVRYAYRNGVWDEWYLQLESGKTAWLSEDEESYSLEVLRKNAKTPDYAQTQPGDTLQLAGHTFRVDERDVAECEGGEGQLPFAIMSGERVPFLDLSSGEQFATVEYELDGDVRVFFGQRVAADSIQMDTERPDGDSGPIPLEREGDAFRRERVTRRGDRSLSIRCENCGGVVALPDNQQQPVACASCGSAIDLTARRVACPMCDVATAVRGDADVRMLTCSGCGQQIDISRAEPTAIGSLVGRRKPRVPIKLGQPVTYAGVKYIVVGHIRYVEREYSDCWYANEFLLHAADAGYAWLILEEGHYSFCRELNERPTGFEPRTAQRKQKFTFLDRDWKVFEQCHKNYVVDYVDGELTWVAQVGDVYSYLDATSPPYLLSAEWTDTEMEWYQSEYLSPPQAADALGIDPAGLPSREGVAPHQPYRPSRSFEQSGLIGLACAVAFLMLALFSLLSKGEPVIAFQLQPDQYRSEYITKAFEITQAPALCAARFESPLHNAWVYLDIALLDDQDQALLDFSAEISYYTGTEGGESWTEGHQSDTQVFKVSEPGQYRLLVLGQGEGAAQPVGVSIAQGVSISRYYLAGAVVSGLWMIVVFGRRAVFEGQRWAEEDDDDDDDDD